MSLSAEMEGVKKYSPPFDLTTAGTEYDCDWSKGFVPNVTRGASLFPAAKPFTGSRPTDSFLPNGNLKVRELVGGSDLVR